jgi:uncharacterized membrane protein
MYQKEIKKLLANEDAYLLSLRKIIEESVTQEKNLIESILNPEKESLTKGQKLSDKVASFGGSWKFIISFFTILFTWILVNIALATHAFDPYPFILLNLVLSCVAALQAPVVMMSQNRIEEKDRKRNESDYLVNLKAEIEIRSLHQKVDLLLGEQIKTLFETQARQMVLLNKIEAKLERILKENPTSSSHETLEK